MEPPIASCHYDDEPVVFTMLWRRYEFFCVRCGSHYTYFGPKARDHNPELELRLEENEMLFKELTEGMIGDGVYYDRCEDCKGGVHMSHAMPEELDADLTARRRLTDHLTKVSRGAT